MSEEIVRKSIEKLERHTARQVRAVVFKAAGEEEISRPGPGIAVTRAMSDDPFESVSSDLVEPPYDPNTLVKLSEISITLAGAIETMEANIPGFGHRLVSRLPANASEELKQAATHERRAIENRLRAFSREMSFTKLRRMRRRDEEKTGNAYLEFIRNPSTNVVVACKWLKSQQMRITKQDPDYTDHIISVPQINEDGTAGYMKLPASSRFRRYVQAVQSSTLDSAKADNRVRYFKEYGDPRIIDNLTGRVVTEEQAASFEDTEEPMPEYRKASEVYHFGTSDRSVYGIPRWVSAIMSVIGTRSGDTTNIHTIQNNGIPSLMMTVSNGRLTAGTIKRITDYVDNHVKGNANFSTVLLVEGESEYEGDESNQVKIDVHPLEGSQIRDMLFGDYIKSNEERVLQSFRLPPIYLGLAGGYNKSTAELSRRLADEQVFAPERDEEDWFFNNVLFAEWGVEHWMFVTNTPNVTDNKDLILMLTAAERTGGVTPRISRTIVEEVFPKLGEDVRTFKPPTEGGIDPDVPYSIQVAERIKNQALGGEINQQVAPVMPPANPTLGVPEMKVEQIEQELVKLAEAIEDLEARVE